MALPPHSYIRHVYTQALCVHDCTCICVYMIVCKYMYVQCIHIYKKYCGDIRCIVIAWLATPAIWALCLCICTSHVDFTRIPVCL